MKGKWIYCTGRSVSPRLQISWSKNPIHIFAENPFPGHMVTRHLSSPTVLNICSIKHFSSPLFLSHKHISCYTATCSSTPFGACLIKRPTTASWRWQLHFCWNVGYVLTLEAAHHRKLRLCIGLRLWKQKKKKKNEWHARWKTASSKMAVDLFYSVNSRFLCICSNGSDWNNLELHFNWQASNEGSIIWKPSWPICHHCIIDSAPGIQNYVITEILAELIQSSLCNTVLAAVWHNLFNNILSISLRNLASDEGIVKYKR